MVLVVRGELRLTAGKIAAQVAHAAVELARRSERSKTAESQEWWRTGQRKIVLVCPTLVEMKELERLARAARIPTAWVEDAGLTEVPPRTVTCLGIGPGASTAIDRVTGHLDLY
ncbi:MAG: aminoacyl-tRNA hydrolase [Thermoplasmata archaeon]